MSFIGAYRVGMIAVSLEDALKQSCRPAIMGRARRLVADGDKIHRRKCRYEGDKTYLDARVDAGGSWDAPHHAHACVLEQGEQLEYFECNCDAARSNADVPCKHVAALVLDFCEQPQSYVGYESQEHVRTSSAIARLMERVAHAPVPVAGASTESTVGTVSIVPVLIYEAGFGVRFKLVGERGTYVIKSITDFVGCVEKGAFWEYGKRLAFVHTARAFTPQGWQVANFVVRAVRNRRAYAFDRAVGAGPLGAKGSPQREMHLSSVELWDLLDLFADDAVVFEDRSAAQDADRAAKSMRVRHADPVIAFTLTPIDNGAYELARKGGVRLTNVGGRALAWDATSLYCCSDELSASVSKLATIMGAGSERLVVAERDVSMFAAYVLPLLEDVSRVEVPDDLEALRPAPCELQFYLDREQQGIVCEAFAVYGSEKLPLGSRDEREGVVRDAKAEARGRALLRHYFEMTESGALLVPNTDDDAMAAFVFGGVGELQQIGTVYATDAFDRLKSKARPKAKMELAVRSGLLDLRVSVDGLSSEELAALLESYKLRKRYHRLDDGSFIDLSNARLAKMATVVDELGISQRQLARGEATVPAYRAFLLGDEADPSWRDASLDRYLEQMRSIDAADYEPPASLSSVMRPYQVEGYAWMRALVDQGLAGVLADEMGLGKSLQLIALLLARRNEAHSMCPSLVVCPASLVYNWAQEFAKFAPSLAVGVVVGTVDERAELRRRRFDVLITSYDLLRRDVGDYARHKLWLVALDEAQYIKNHDTIAARAVKTLDCTHRFALTGTPIENRLSELWSIFDFLMPGLLGSYEMFRDRYERVAADGEGPDHDRSARLAKALSPFVLRRTKREVLTDLPDKLEQVVYARMEHAQRVLYDAQVNELRSRLAEPSGDDKGAMVGGGRMQVLAALMRLRQTCCDPRLVFEDYDGPSCKVGTIVTLVQRVIDAGERVLLFSQFTSYLSLLSARLDECGIAYYTLTGSTSKRRRMELVESFNTGSTPVFMISLKAGGTGLNLTGASVVIHADPWWNAAAQDQATDRAHRMGQTREVTVYKVICADTLEERIQDLQRRKSDLAERVVGRAGSGSLAGLTADELAELFV